MNNFYLYTETAYHHQGSLTYLKSLIDATVEAGASGIKFQVLTHPEDKISTRHSAFKELASYCFTYEEWSEIFTYTIKNDLDIIMMPLNEQALNLANEFPVKFIDIHSISFNDNDLLKAIKTSGTNVILGVGGRTIDEIAQARNFFKNQLKILMVGFQSFPTKLEDVKMSKISILKTLFPKLKIGYADHSSYESEYAISSNEFARILGAEIFEKHIAIEEGKKRLDYEAAISKEKIREVIQRIKFLEENILLPTESAITMTDPELVYRNRQLRCVVSRNVDVGEKFEKEDISLKMVKDQENACSHVNEVVGKRACRSFKYDEAIYRKDIE